MAFNKNELILDKVRSLTAHDLSTGEVLFRLTSLEDPRAMRLPTLLVP